LPYRIVWYPDTHAHLRSLTPRQRSIVFDEVEEQLTHEPKTETRNRKEMRPNPLASWELRIGDLRVYDDVTEKPQTVIGVAVGIKRGNRVFIGGEKKHL
jgi:mRNA-degrading endonuclease RelE of RelBE toxin-antitoxin system